MKNSSSLFRLILIVAVTLSVTAVAGAQNRERFGISAKAGGVNLVVGRVMVTRSGQASQLLSNKDDLVTGDRVETGAGAHAEVLLNPGSYLRLGEDTEFEFVDSSLDKLQVKLVRGSAIIEATGVDKMELRIGVLTPPASFTIVRTGLYRINIQANTTEFLVKNGRAIFGDDRDNQIKKGHKVTFSNGTPVDAKLTKEKDEFELWSKQRAEFLARANERLSARALNGYLSSFHSWDMFSWGGTWGLWTFSSRAGCFTFLPFYYGWSSPYGHYYGSYYYFPRPWYQGPASGGPVIVNNQGGNPSGVSGGPPGGTSPGPMINPNPGSSGPPMQSPPPARMDPDTGMRSVNKSREP